MPGSRVPLAISIVLNVFLLGALIGGTVWLELSKPRPAGTLQAVIQQLPEPELSDLHHALRDVRRDLRQTMLEGRQARRDAADLLQQPKLDTVALLAALDRARTADIAIRTKLEQRIVEFAATSSPQIRQLLAEGLVRNFQNRH
ncbi:MAG: periplasmic heavy metal sensor [Pseudomonadota bacterium]